MSKVIQNTFHTFINNLYVSFIRSLFILMCILCSYLAK